MSKVILEFTLPDEREEAMLAQSAGKMSCVISELDNFLRAINKYGHEEFKDPSACEAAQRIRDELRNLVASYDLQEIVY